MYILWKYATSGRWQFPQWALSLAVAPLQYGARFDMQRCILSIGGPCLKMVPALFSKKQAPSKCPLPKSLFLDHVVCPPNPEKSKAGAVASPVGKGGLGCLESVDAPRPWGVREHQYSCGVDACVCPRNHSGDMLPYLCENKTFRGCCAVGFRWKECLWFFCPGCWSFRNGLSQTRRMTLILI